MSERQLPKIGTAVWIRKGGKVLLGRRTKKDNTLGTWGPAGGHLEMNETLLECTHREAAEETGVKIKDVRFVIYLEDVDKEHNKHYVTFYYIANWESGEPVPQDGEFDRLDWFNWHTLPQPLFRPAQLFVDLGINPFD